MGILDSIATGGLSTIVSTALEIANKFIEDPQKKMEAQIQMLQITQSSEFKQMDVALQQQQMQADINKVEAASEAWWKSGWRPFIGWVCGAGFALHVVLFPLMEAMLQPFGIKFVQPQMQVELMMSILTGMLGLGAYRTVEKVKKAN